MRCGYWHFYSKSGVQRLSWPLAKVILSMDGVTVSGIGTNIIVPRPKILTVATDTFGLRSRIEFEGGSGKESLWVTCLGASAIEKWYRTDNKKSGQDANNDRTSIHR
jgi:hypothetical protein